MAATLSSRIKLDEDSHIMVCAAYDMDEIMGETTAYQSLGRLCVNEDDPPPTTSQLARLERIGIRADGRGTDCHGIKCLYFNVSPYEYMLARYTFRAAKDIPEGVRANIMAADRRITSLETVTPSDGAIRVYVDFENGRYVAAARKRLARAGISLEEKHVFCHYGTYTYKGLFDSGTAYLDAGLAPGVAA